MTTNLYDLASTRNTWAEYGAGMQTAAVATSRAMGVMVRLAPVLFAVVAMWLVTAVNFLLLQGAWLAYGVRAHDPSGFWPDVLFAPFLHLGPPHLLRIRRRSPCGVV